MKLAYFVHDLSDPAVLKRVRMLHAGGAQVTVLGFCRADLVPPLDGAKVVNLGLTHDGQMGRRAISALKAAAGSARWRRLLDGTQVIVARNLEMLAIAAAARRTCGLHAPLAYECLDIHRLMLDQALKGRALRRLERSLLADISLLIVSSPAFVDAYFRPVQQISAPVLLLENKVLDLDGAAPAPHPIVPGPPWRIGWMGALRCRRSLAFLSDLAARRPDLVQVRVHGRPAVREVGDLQAAAAVAPGLDYFGSYSPADLPAIYGGVHFAWAVDFMEEGQNSAWLLPNRIYESARFGVPPIALAGVETGRCLRQRRYGLVLDGLEGLEAALEAMTTEAYVAHVRACEATPQGDLAFDREDCVALVQRLAQLSPSTPQPKPLPHDASRRALIVIPCLNEAAQIEQVVTRILSDDQAPPCRLVIADGGSTDGTQDIVRRLGAGDPRISLLANPKRLQSAGVNLAVRELGVGHDWLVRVDAHADYPEGYVSSLIAEAERTGATSVVVAMDTRGESGFQRAAAAAQNSVLGAGGSAHRMGGRGWVDHGHHALFQMNAFTEVGGYDESFSHNEDAELDTRLAQRGGHIWLTDKVVVGYYPRRTPSALWSQYLNYGRGRAKTVAKHRARMKLRQLLPLAVAPAVLLALGAGVHWLLAAPALLWLGATLTAGLVLGLGKSDAAARASGVPAAIMHLAWSTGFWLQTLERRPRAIADIAPEPA